MSNLSTVSLTSGVPYAGDGNVSTLDNMFGTAGTANANILSVQGVTGGVAQNTTLSGATFSSGALSVYGTFSSAGVSTVTATVSNPVTTVTISGTPTVISTVSGVTVSSNALQVYGSFSTTPATSVVITGITISGSSLSISGSSLNVNIGTPTVGISNTSRTITGNVSVANSASTPLAAYLTNVSGVSISTSGGGLLVYGSFSTTPASSVSINISGSGVTASSLNVNLTNAAAISGVTVSASSLQVYGSFSTTPATSVGITSFSISGVNASISGSSLNVNVTNPITSVSLSGVTVSSAALQVYGSFSTTPATSVTITAISLSGSALTATASGFLNTNLGATVSSSTLAAYLPAATFTSSAATSSQGALVVAISPNGVNPNGRTTPLSSAPVVFASQTYQSVGASSTNVPIVGSVSGSTGDYLDGLLIIPSSVSPGVVQILDLSTSTTVFAGGTTSLSNLVPFFIPVGAVSKNGRWGITTGSSVTALATGNFT